MQEILSNYISSKNFTDLVLSYFNLSDEEPKATNVKKEDLIFGAWAVTGKHLREALNQYGKELEATTSSSRR